MLPRYTRQARTLLVASQPRPMARPQQQRLVSLPKASDMMKSVAVPKAVDDFLQSEYKEEKVSVR